MLPDLPNLKKDLRKIFNQYIDNQVNARIGVFKITPRKIIHEGNLFRMIRADGTIEDSSIIESTSEISLPYDEIPHLTHQDIITKMNTIADTLANKISGNLLRTLNDSIEAAGQSINYEGKPFDVEALFAVLEKIQINFDETGKHHQLTMIINPQHSDKVKLVMKEIETNPEIQKRYNELMERKRMEWRDREAHRELVG
ncbi:hypothetical protein LLG96_06300 [bacterium]|nr:hypothetical protein [bacterium]